MAKDRRKRHALAGSFDIAYVEPLTENQEIAFESNKNLVMCGSAGCGKSFLGCYFGIKDITKSKYSNIVIIRSAVPSRDMGYLPGNQNEKSSAYEEPYRAIFAELLGRGDSYDILKQKGVLAFTTTSYLRGLTFRDSFVIVDECQNMEFKELNTIITRLGENCRIAFCGDFKQTDLQKNGLQMFLKVLRELEHRFDIIEFTTKDIVRSDLVREYIIAAEKVGAQ